MEALKTITTPMRTATLLNTKPETQYNQVILDSGIHMAGMKSEILYSGLAIRARELVINDTAFLQGEATNVERIIDGKRHYKMLRRFAFNTITRAYRKDSEVGKCDPLMVSHFIVTYFVSMGVESRSEILQQRQPKVKQLALKICFWNGECFNIDLARFKELLCLDDDRHMTEFFPGSQDTVIFESVDKLSLCDFIEFNLSSTELEKIPQTPFTPPKDKFASFFDNLTLD